MDFYEKSRVLFLLKFSWGQRILICFAKNIEGHLFAALLPLLYLIPHVLTWRRMVQIHSGKKLNSILGETSRNMLLMGILLSIGFLIRH